MTDLKKTALDLFIAAFLTILAVGAWFNFPTAHQLIKEIDESVFFFSNSSVSEKGWWSCFWASMNSPAEKWLNLIYMLTVQLVVVFYLRHPPFLQSMKSSICILLIYWLGLQTYIYFQHIVYRNIFEISRLSPTLVLEPRYLLSALYENPAIKDQSVSSFPGGHAFAAALWAFYTTYFSSIRMKIFIWLSAIILCSARVISGAHWFSDIAYSIASAYIIYLLLLLLVLAIHRDHLRYR